MTKEKTIQTDLGNIFVDGDGSTPVIHFQNHSATATQIIWTKASNIPSTDDAYDFVPTNNDMVPTHYKNNYPKRGYTHSPPEPPARAPFVDSTKFLAGVQNDSLLTADPTLSFQLGSILPMLQLDLQLLKETNKPEPLQSHWKSIIENYAGAADGGKGVLGTWLRPNIQKMILKHAETHNIPLRS